ncbi:hypothetical protein [Sphingomonas sp. R86521]|uniref:hypothetical protein n=1 Tax=Sphingomonas sp. R86521 TaxID=3093860 RepID=UPI0036D35031
MIALLALLAQIAPPAIVPTQPTIVAPLPPQDWSTLPILRVRRAASDLPDLSAFVRAEVDAGRCAAAYASPQGWTLKIDLAVLATPTGQVRRITPRAIDCPTVEQYAAGLVLGTARDNVDVRGALADTWYRTSMTFAWSQ